MDERINEVLARLEALNGDAAHVGGTVSAGANAAAGAASAGANATGGAATGRAPDQFWNVPKTTAGFLNILVKAIKARKVLEIGTSNGYSGIHLAEALSHTEGLLYTVESHKGRFAAAAENFKKAGLEKFVRQVAGHAPEIFAEKMFAGVDDFDLVFIDATKMEYAGYLDAVLPMVRQGGLIVADNCLSHRAELGEFFEYIKRLELKNTLLTFDNGVMLILK